MLNLTVKPGEYFLIGDDIKVIFAGGTANNARVMIDAPRSYNIVRGKVLEQAETEGESAGKEEGTEFENVPSKSSGKRKQKKYYVEPEIPKERLEGFLRQQKARQEQDKSTKRKL